MPYPALFEFRNFIKRYFFLLGLLVITVVTLSDGAGKVILLGKWLKTNHGPSVSIFLIFIISGLIIDAEKIRNGLTDYKSILVTLLIIFIAAPLIGFALVFLPLDPGVKIGLFLVSVMPTTLSSGIVMTGTAGGDMARSLVITIIANALSVFTIPLTLPLLLATMGGDANVMIDKGAMTVKLLMLVLLPLSIGLICRQVFTRHILPFLPRLQLVNQILILCLVWMGLSQSRNAILGGGETAGLIVVLAFFYHALLIGVAGFFIWRFRFERGRRESILFMGGQKTLTLAVILQVSLFPEYGLALAFCVIHHIVHLMMDGWLAGKLSGGVPAS